MIRRTVRGLGEVLITSGLIILLFAAYEVYGKAFEVAAEQNRLDAVLEKQWDTKPPAAQPGAAPVAEKPAPGVGMSRMYIPRLGRQWIVVEGVKPGDIKLAPGHYPNSQQPGQVGNFAIAGHRTPTIFWDLDKMQDGDPIVVETQTGWHVYRVDTMSIVHPTKVDVVAANPDKPGAPPVEKYLTITTCNPKWDNYERLVVRASLEREQGRDKGRPAELGGA